MRKHQYRILINQGQESSKPYVYAYKNTRNIQLSIQKNSAVISFEQGVERQPEDLLSSGDHICSDAIKKLMLLHLVLYKEPICIQAVELVTDEVTTEVYSALKKKEPLVYSMITNDLDHLLPQAWRSKEVIQTILDTPKTAFDGRNNALIALLIAKSKQYRCEKMMYLWMAMSGFYGFFSKIANQSGKKIEEWKQQDLLCQLAGIGKASESLKPEARNKMMQEALSILGKSDQAPELLYNELCRGATNTVSEQLEGMYAKYQTRINYYTFFVIWLPYQVRCAYFHTNRAIPLFAYADERLLKALAYINYFMERFLEEHLPSWFQSRIISEEEKQKISSAFQRNRVSGDEPH